MEAIQALDEGASPMLASENFLAHLVSKLKRKESSSDWCTVHIPGYQIDQDLQAAGKVMILALVETVTPGSELI